MNRHCLSFAAYGKAAEVLEWQSMDLPALEKGEVLLKIAAAPINPADLNFIAGNYGTKPTLPSFAGMECSATVIQSRAENLSPGDIVMPLKRIGSWASHAVTSAENLISLPREIDLVQAAMLRVNPATAWLLLRHFDKLQAGDWVVFNASNSGVGQCIIQLAAIFGIRSLCFVRKTEHVPMLLTLGANAVFEDSTQGHADAMELVKGKIAKLAFNAVGGESALRLLKYLRPGGSLITYGAMARKPLTIPNASLIFDDIRIRGLWVSRWLETAPRHEIEATYQQLSALVIDGKLNQCVDSIFGLQDFPEALARCEASDRNGKVLFRT
jgi:trans-2-enoyl-CoA reductase